QGFFEVTLPSGQSAFTRDGSFKVTGDGLIVTSDGYEVAPGITVHHSPGHSKGMQSVRVLTESGWVVLAVDAAHFYENFEKRKPFVIAHSIEDMLTTFDQLEDLASSPEHVIPGHDPLVFERYPALSADTQGFVHRLDRGRG
ncbi:MAG: hypothetical protein AAFO62_13490, partial [Pseudomonadota bacterium]